MAQRFGLKIRTRLAFEELDNVMGQYCQAGYSIAIGGLDDSGPVRKKIMILYFEKSEDRDRLRALFAARGARTTAMQAAESSEAANQPGTKPVAA